MGVLMRAPSVEQAGPGPRQPTTSAVVSRRIARCAKPAANSSRGSNARRHCVSYWWAMSRCCAVAAPFGLPRASRQLRQQPCRLQRHAHAFADDRMRLAGGVADAERAAVRIDVNARVERPGGEPGTVRVAGRSAMRTPRHWRLQIRLDHVARAHSRRGEPTGFQAIATDTACDGGQAVVGNHHAAIAAVEREYRQQAVGQVGLAEVRLERQQVGRAAASAARPGAPTAVPPTSRARRSRRARAGFATRPAASR